MPPALRNERDVSVGDRASDVFSYLEQTRQLGWQVLLRVSQNRRITTDTGAGAYLLDYMRSLPAQASAEQRLRARKGIAEQVITLQISWSRLWVNPPRQGAGANATALECWCVRCCGTSREGKAIEWVLLSDRVVNDRAAAVQLIGWYEHRWVIEEYHKGLKSGCSIEHRRLQSVAALKAIIAMCSIVAVRLLQLRNLARHEPEQPAISQIERRRLELLILRLALSMQPETMTLREFWHAVARLGGFLARKSDGEPGWQTLWHGWQLLDELYWAAMQSFDPP